MQAAFDPQVIALLVLILIRSKPLVCSLTGNKQQGRKLLRLDRTRVAQDANGSTRHRDLVVNDGSEIRAG